MAETPPEQDLEHDIDEFDERITALEDDLGGAREKAEARSEEARDLDDLADDDIDPDELIGDDAEGGFDDPEEFDEDDEDDDDAA